MKKPQLPSVSSVKSLAKIAKAEAIKHAPGLLTGIGITGMATSTVLAVPATLEAKAIVDEYMKEHELNDISKKEVFRLVWKCYIKCAIAMVAGGVSSIAALQVGERRNALLMATCAMVEDEIKEYKTKVKEEIGIKKEKKIIDSMAEDELSNMPIDESNIIHTGHGDTLFYEAGFGMMFRSSINYMDRTKATIADDMRAYGHLSMSEIFDIWDIPAEKWPELSKSLGYSASLGDIDWSYHPVLNENGNTIIYVYFDTPPRHDYRDI